MQGLLNGVLVIIVLLLIINIVVIVHEFGHYFFAKLNGVPVKEFSVGFGKLLIKRTYFGTQFSLRAVPFGGYVDLEGEQDSSWAHGFRNKRAYQKILILLGGVMFNFLLAAIAFSIFAPAVDHKFTLPAFYNYQFSSAESQSVFFPIRVVRVREDGRSFGKLESGEFIVEINGNSFTSFQNFRDLLKENAGKSTKFTLLDIDTYNTYQKEFELGQPEGESGSILDVELNYDTGTNRPLYFIKFNKDILTGTKLSVDLSIYQLGSLGSIIGEAFSKGDYQELSNSVGGLPQVADQIDFVITSGLPIKEILVSILALVGLINLSLLVFNLLPFPALDGGQIAVVLFEFVTRRKLADSTLQTLNFVGFVVLMGFGLLVTFKDIINLGWIDSIFRLFTQSLRG